MVAASVATLLGINPTTINKALQTFKGMPHRIEWITQIQGVDFYDDSKATTVESVHAALLTFQRPIVWIAGGYDKGNDYALLQPLVRSQVKALICLGKNNQPLLSAFQDLKIPIYETQVIQEAVQMALKCAESGDIVLLSPACASFDLFKNFEDRGNQFKQAVYQAQLTANLS
jgi:UDP-N-acetylmuramoylalanine--D-glutamate ligase